ncbi:hypothetical protein C8R41DRAFT_867108 [Lentinula lateritia]|uniref:Uncharacterized protein n=1 Tax=Lentinula lateritia TaxID=40482 RepID=A0ABQ8VG50_9AGAR|nr:hypothetical protein C8R41DRAFT_867108 [Lentinula lateritia]
MRDPDLCSTIRGWGTMQITSIGPCGPFPSPSIYDCPLCLPGAAITLVHRNYEQIPLFRKTWSGAFLSTILPISSPSKFPRLYPALPTFYKPPSAQISRVEQFNNLSRVGCLSKPPIEGLVPHKLTAKTVCHTKSSCKKRSVRLKSVSSVSRSNLYGGYWPFDGAGPILGSIDHLPSEVMKYGNGGFTVSLSIKHHSNNDMFTNFYSSNRELSQQFTILISDQEVAHSTELKIWEQKGRTCILYKLNEGRFRITQDLQMDPQTLGINYDLTLVQGLSIFWISPSLLEAFRIPYFPTLGDIPESRDSMIFLRLALFSVDGEFQLPRARRKAKL